VSDAVTVNAAGAALPSVLVVGSGVLAVQLVSEKPASRAATAAAPALAVKAELFT
jgi:hypothetical protein